MANRLPADDEQEILDQTDDLTEKDPSDEDIAKELDQPEVDNRNPAAVKYFLNDKLSNRQNGDESKVGQLVGKERDPFQEPESMKSSELNTPTIPQIQTDIPDIKTGDNPKLSLLDQYRQLMQQKQDKNTNLNMLQGANQIAQGIASGYGGKIGDGSEAVNQLRKNADQPLEQFLGQGKVAELKSTLENNDANSDISKLARQQAVLVMQKLNPTMTKDDIQKLNDNFSTMSASELEKLGFKGVTALSKAGMSEYQKAMVDIMNRRLAGRDADRDLTKSKMTVAEEKELSKDSQKLESKINSLDASQRTAFGKIAQSANSARTIQSITNGVKDLNDLTAVQLSELAANAASMLTNSTTLGAVDSLKAHQLSIDAAKGTQYFTGMVDGAGGGEYAQQILDLAKRIDESADKQMQAKIGLSGAAFWRLKDKMPDKFNEIMSLGRALPKELTKAVNSQSTQQPVPSKTQDEKIAQYAKDNKIDYPHAEAILKARGYNPNE